MEILSSNHSLSTETVKNSDSDNVGIIEISGTTMVTKTESVSESTHPKGLDKPGKVVKSGVKKSPAKKSVKKVTTNIKNSKASGRANKSKGKSNSQSKPGKVQSTSSKVSSQTQAKTGSKGRPKIVAAAKRLASPVKTPINAKKLKSSQKPKTATRKRK